MRAMYLHGVGDLRMQDVPSPVSDGVVVDIAYTGICGSDLHYYDHGANGAYVVREPLILGHETVGAVRSIGNQAARLDDLFGVGHGIGPGTRVAIHPARPTPPPDSAEGAGLNVYVGGSYLGSASTTPHTQGALAERLEVLPEQLRLLPENLPLRRAALIEPLSVALHAVNLLGSRIDGASVFVSGAGPIGCLVAVAAKHRGAGRVTIADLHELPLKIGASIGADALVRIGDDPPPSSESFDVVIETSGAVSSLATCLDAVRRQGTIVQLGMLPGGDIAAPLSSLIAKEVALLGSQRFDIEIDEAVRVAAAHDELDHLVTHVVPFEQAAEAFELAADPASSSKVVIRVGG